MQRLQGRSDIPLDDLGIRQAREVAGALSRINRVITSPLSRARETAEALGLPVEIDERWIELDYGDFEGMLQADVPDDVWSRWRKDSAFRPPNGETLDELDARVRSALSDIFELAMTENIAIVSHVSPIKAAIAWSIGASVGSAWNCLLDRASISTIAIRDHGPVMVTFNNTSHLSEI
jgi:probable phosphoglycerate mutase